MKTIYCTNCGKSGHNYKNCKNPIISYGIMLFKYELEEGDHTLNIKILNPNKNAYLRLDNLIVYQRKI